MKTKRVITDSASARRRAHLSHPHHLRVILDDVTPIQLETHRADVDDLNQGSEVSATPKWTYQAMRKRQRFIGQIGHGEIFDVA